MNNEQLAILEGLLFVAGEEGVDNENVKLVLNIDDNKVKELVTAFKETLQADNRGLMLVTLGNKYKLTTKPEHFAYYNKLIDNSSNFSFSNAALETLAIVAYNQPLTRVEVENIRGVNSDGMIRKLVAKSLLREVGRRETVGRPMMYEVTPEFMDYFNLTNLEELPDLTDIEMGEENEASIFESQFKENETNG